MTFEFQCPQCHAQRTATDQIIGRKVRCPNCGELVVATESRPAAGEWTRDDQHGETQFDLPADEVRKKLEEKEFQNLSEVDTWQEDDTPFLVEPVAQPAQPDELASPPPSEAPPSGTETTIDLPLPVAPPSEPQTPDRPAPEKSPPPDGRPSASGPSASFSFHRRGDNGREESEMDMTPMVDVTFLLLIFFMVTASFALQKAITTQAEEQDEPSPNVTMEEFEDNADVVIVRIDEFNTYHVLYGDKNPIQAPSPHELLRQLRIAKQGVKIEGRLVVPKKLLVSAHGKATNNRVIKAMDAGTEVGMNQVQVVLDEGQW